MQLKSQVKVKSVCMVDLPNRLCIGVQGTMRIVIIVSETPMYNITFYPICTPFYLRSKKFNYMFLRHRPRHLQSPRTKNFFCISSIHIEKSSIHCELSVWSAVICAILFVDWLVRIPRVKKFSGNYSDTSFYSILFNKIKNKKLPASILFVDWLVRIPKVKKFSGNYSDTSFYSILFNKIKIKSRPPASFLKKVPEKHIINLFSLITPRFLTCICGLIIFITL